MADAQGPVTSAPSQDWQPYDAAADGSMAGWDKLPAGPADLNTGRLAGEDFPDGPGPWRQC